MGEGSDYEGGGEGRPVVGIRWKKWIGRALGGLLLLMIVGSAGVNILLNVSWGKGAIERSASQLAGVPVEVGRILAMPWGSVRLFDIRGLVFGGEKESQSVAPLVFCREMRIDVAPLSLLTRNVHLRRIELTDAMLSLTRSESGGFLLPNRLAVAAAKQGGERVDPGVVMDAAPGASEEPASVAAVMEAPPRLVVPESGLGEEKSAENFLAEASAEEVLPKKLLREGEKDSGEVSVFEVPLSNRNPHPIVIHLRGRNFHLGELILRRGELQVTSLEEGQPLLEVGRVEMAIDLGVGAEEPGRIEIERVRLFDAIEMKGFRGEVVRSGPWIDFRNFKANVEGGVLDAKVRTSPFFAGIPFLVGVRVQKAGVEALASQLLDDFVVKGGQLDGKGTVVGRLLDASSFRGEGDFKVVDARLGMSEIFESVSKTMKTDALEDVGIEDFFVKFRMVGRNIGIDDLRVSSPDVMLAGRGGVSVQGPLNLAIRLYLSDRAYFGVRFLEKIFPEGRTLGFAPFEGSTERFYRDYLINGTVQDPLINFWEPETMQRVTEVKGQFFRLIGTTIKENQVER